MDEDIDIFEDKNTKLHVAVANGDMESVQREIDAGASVNCENAMGWTPLMEAIRNGNLEITKFLLNKKANVTKCNKHGCGVLDLAIASGNLEMVHLILQHMLRGGISRQTIGRHISPISSSIIHGHHNILKYLAEQSFDIFEDNATGVTPAEIASMMGNMEAYTFLRSMGAIHNPPVTCNAPEQLINGPPTNKKGSNQESSTTCKSKAENLYHVPAAPPPSPVDLQQQVLQMSMPSTPVFLISPAGTGAAFSFSPIMLNANANFVNEALTPSPENMMQHLELPVTRRHRLSSNVSYLQVSPGISPVPILSPMHAGAHHWYSPASPIYDNVFNYLTPPPTFTVLNSNASYFNESDLNFA